MAEPKGSIRMSITVPSELKDQMDAIKESVNWSGVAAEAFRGKLQELASQRGGKTMQDVIDRLKAAEKIESNEGLQKGYAAGENWAKTKATPKQLRRLDNANLDDAFDVEPDAFGYSGILFTIINGDFCDRVQLQEYWDGVLGDWKEIEEGNGSFAYGFAEGAAKIWRSVKSKI